MDLFDDNGALFSDDRKHRLKLWRIWDNRLPKIMFIGLNPSTANENEADPTITRVVNFAKSWGYGGVYMMNLHTYVTPKPEELVYDDNHVENFTRIEALARECEKIIFAWGNFKIIDDRHLTYISVFKEAYCLKKNKNGSPIHPLYVKGATVPIKYQ